MRLYKLFVDVHMYGCYEIECDWEYGPDCFYLGDNIDLACCLPEQVELAKNRLRGLKKAFEGRYVSGNHELEPANHLKVGDVLMTHGDYLFWTCGQADTYRARKPGMHPLLRTVVRWFVKDVLARRDWEISENTKKKCKQLALDYGCNTIVCGHWHPRRLHDFMYEGVRIVVLPRGRTDIYL